MAVLIVNELPRGPIKKNRTSFFVFVLNLLLTYTTPYFLPHYHLDSFFLKDQTNLTVPTDCQHYHRQFVLVFHCFSCSNFTNNF
jgi:hypothetical protein